MRLRDKIRSEATKRRPKDDVISNLIFSRVLFDGRLERILKVRKKSGNRERCRKLSL